MGRPRYMKIGTNAVHGMHTGPMQMKGMVHRVERVRHELFGGRIRDGYAEVASCPYTGPHYLHARRRHEAEADELLGCC